MSDPINFKPHMDNEGLLCFLEATERSKCYLEYGSGGSTVHAANVANIPIIISIESDPIWSEKVKSQINQTQSKSYISYCDIGPVGDWGTPRNKDKINDFWKYIVTPWAIARMNHFVPDTVLIDGRFRVASFLYSLVAARTGTMILFDDYLDRPHYFVAEEFCSLHSKHGRLAVFRVSKQFSVQNICASIAQYSVIWD